MKCTCFIGELADCAIQYILNGADGNIRDAVDVFIHGVLEEIECRRLAFEEGESAETVWCPDENQWMPA